MLASYTSVLSNADVKSTLDALSNGAFERQAINDLYSNGMEGIISVGDNGEIRLGENSLVTKSGRRRI